MNEKSRMKITKLSSSSHDRRPPWPEAVQILVRRKLLARNYQLLVGELRSHKRAAAVYSRNPSPSALEQVGTRRRRLNTVLGRYIDTLAELRSAVEVVFPPGYPHTRRGLARPRL